MEKARQTWPSATPVLPLPGENDTLDAAVAEYVFAPIGVVRSPFLERSEAPRQPIVSGGARGTIELHPGRGFEDALEGLEAWEYAWVLSVFHENVEQRRGWHPKVQPPRSRKKVGVFATRSPHRPNPIGLSAVRIERVDGLVVHVTELDLLDGTPVLDLKPYVPYADARPGAKSGWLDPADPLQAWEVAFAERASAQLAWLRERGLEVKTRIESVLALGPQPHAYRRIRKRGDGLELAVKEWRVDFTVEGRRLVVHSLRSGYRSKELATEDALQLHRDFTGTFGESR
jgi:tRNA-Thr(GGU) m(6)t(6)A37 methyltransferase TsaA